MPQGDFVSKERHGGAGRPERGRRAIDIASAGIILLLALPVLLIVSALIPVFMGRPIFFSQPRIGRDGKLFSVYKFRTMKHEEFPGQPDYQRTTRFSRAVRALSIDELPQLLNILRGDMSLIGPRPLPPAYMEHQSDRHKGRDAIRPGLTGWAQVNGRNALTLPERFEHDLWYIENRTWKLDLRIVRSTVWMLVRPRGVVGPGGVIPYFPTEATAEREAA